MTMEAAATKTSPNFINGIVPYLNIDGAVKAAEFYARAFGAEEVARQPVDEKGRTMHIHLRVHGGSLMLSDPFPEHGFPSEPPKAFTLHLQVEDVDGWWKRATEAGATIRMPLDRMFWGDRYGELVDPFGFSWSIGGR